jgi:S1-C subfamily serine protease
MRNIVILLVTIAINPITVGIAADSQVEPEKAVVYIQVGYRENNVFSPVEDGSGFLINSAGWVVAAQHVIDTKVPLNKTKEIRGAVGSITADAHQLFLSPGAVVSADVALLRFSPLLSNNWPHLKILLNHTFSFHDNIVAYGFPHIPQLQELSTRTGKVSGLLGPHNSIQVNAGIAPGMSGGPVVLEGTSCVVGVIAGGSDYPNYDFVIPVQYARALLDVAPAEFVTVITQFGQGSAAADLFDRSFQVDETYDEHMPFSKSSHNYDIPFTADTGSRP